MNSPAVELDPAKVAAARLWAAAQLPYLASALFACTVRAAAEPGAVTIDEGWQVRADPELVEQLSAPELGRQFVHLVSHLLRDHGGRARALRVDEANAAWWNTCADAEINDDLAAAGNLPPMANTQPADLGQPDSRLVEDYFHAEPPPEATSMSCGPGADGMHRDGDREDSGLRPSEAELVRAATATEIRRISEQQPGTVPGGWLRWAEMVLPSRVDWRRILAAEIRRAIGAASGQVDYTYRRPSRRQHTPLSAATGQPILPSLFRPVPNVAVVCDTSGSMDDDLLNIVLAEVDSILAKGGLRSNGLTALAVDTDVHSSRRVTRATQIDLLGGGGTNMTAGIEAAARLRPRPELVIVLTDGYTPWPDRPPAGARVVVGIVGGSPDAETPSWARAVAINPR